MKEELRITSRTPEETARLGRELGKRIGPGIVIALSGDLGSGKTCLIQGLAAGLGISEDRYITSPTFTLVNAYPGDPPFYHIDLYRLGVPVDIFDTGLYDLLSGEGVIAIEWAEKIRQDLPSERIEIRLEIGEGESRRMRITGYGLRESNLVKRLARLFPGTESFSREFKDI
jgi:tRNA threonylcarbamoyladenosine biosynthesis protein TsaE